MVRLGCEVVVPTGMEVGTSVVDSPTIGDTPCTGSRSIPITSGLIGTVVLTFSVVVLLLVGHLFG